MRRLKPFLRCLLAAAALGPLSTAALAQTGVALPPGLNQDSTLADVLAWLDKNSFPRARIGLNNEFYSSHPESDQRTIKESAVFSQGFRLFRTDGCHLTLRHDDARVIRFSTTAFSYEYQSLESIRKSEDTRTPRPAELHIRLNRVSQDRFKAPYLHTNKQEEGKLLGWWRTEFKQMRGISRPSDVLLIVFPDLPPGRGMSTMYGGSVTFTFDDPEASEQFFAAFSRAVKLCH